MAPRQPVSLARQLASSGGTANQQELDKFAAMAGEWWNVNGVCQPLHSMNRLRVPLVRDCLVSSGLAQDPALSDTPLAGIRILDVGCGAGILSEPLARLGANVTAIDACELNIEAAKIHAKLDPSLATRLQFLCTTVEEHCESVSDLYDAVVASEVIEHVDNPGMFVNKCASLLRPEGSFFLTTLNRTTRSWLAAIIGAERLLGLLPPGTHQWEKARVWYHGERYEIHSSAFVPLTCPPFSTT